MYLDFERVDVVGTADVSRLLVSTRRGHPP
jgi:hypothetical protein